MMNFCLFFCFLRCQKCSPLTLTSPQDNLFTLKTLFKKLDPAVLNGSGTVEGELKVSCKFVQQLLLVKVLFACYLILQRVLLNLTSLL